MKKSFKEIIAFVVLILLALQGIILANSRYKLENKYLKLEVETQRGGRIVSLKETKTNSEWTFDNISEVGKETTRALGGLITEHIDRSYPSEASVGEYKIESYKKDNFGTELILSYDKFTDYPGLKLVRRMYLAVDKPCLEVSMKFMNHGTAVYLLSPFVEGFMNIFSDNKQLLFSIPTSTRMQHLTYGDILAPCGFNYWLVPARGWFYASQGDTGLNFLCDFSKLNAIYTNDGVSPYYKTEHPRFEIHYIPFGLKPNDEWETTYSINLAEGAIKPITSSQNIIADATSKREEDGKAEVEVSLLSLIDLGNITCDVKAVRGNTLIDLGEQQIELKRGQTTTLKFDGFEIPKNGYTCLQLSFRDNKGKELIIDPINKEQYLEIPLWHGKYSREIYTPLEKQQIDAQYVALIKRNAVQPDSIKQYAARVQPKESEGKLISSSKDFQIWSEEPIVKVSPDDFAPVGKPEPEIKLYGAKNERVSFQLVIKPSLAKGEMKLDIQPLMHESRKGKIEADNIKSYLQKYLETEIVSSLACEIGKYPDPLVECRNFTINSQENQPLWLTIYIPEGMPAGTYNGTWSIIADDKEITKVEVSLRVWDFSLPTTSNLRTAFGLWDQYIASRHGLDKNGPKLYDLVRKYRENMLEHRLGFGSLGMPEVVDKNSPVYNFEKYDQELDYYMAKGLNAFAIGSSFPLGYVDLESEVRNQINTLKPLCDHLEQRGLLGMAYNYIWDEPGKDRFPALVKAGKVRKQTHPDLKVLLTVGIHDELKDSVDIWVPIIDAFNEEAAKAEKEKGKEVWWYVCCGPKQPYPNFFIDYPAISHRMLFWMTYKYDLDGMLYWATTYWVKDVWQEAESWGGANGDGSLMYWDEKGPVNSLRLEVIRDGVQDYDYLKILEQKTNQLKAFGKPEDSELIKESEAILALPDTLIRTPMDFERSPEKLISARKKVGEQIEKLNKHLSY